MKIASVDYCDPKAAAKFTKSLNQTGFAILTNHPLQWAHVQEVYSEWNSLFQSEALKQYPYDPELQDGYVSTQLSEKAKGANVRDIKEFFGLYYPCGRYPKELTKATRDLSYEMFKLAAELIEWIEDYLPKEIKAKLKQPLRKILCLERTQHRIIHYPPMTGDEEIGAVRSAPHADINLITILPASTEAGLQVLDKHGNWLNVGVNPGELIINIGDMLQELSDFHYISTSHRVINPTTADKNKTRLSMPLFVHADKYAYISDRYPTAETYLHERLVTLGHRENK